MHAAPPPRRAARPPEPDRRDCRGCRRRATSAAAEARATQLTGRGRPGHRGKRGHGHRPSGRERGPPTQPLRRQGTRGCHGTRKLSCQGTHDRRSQARMRIAKCRSKAPCECGSCSWVEIWSGQAPSMSSGTELLYVCMRLCLGSCAHGDGRILLNPWLGCSQSYRTTMWWWIAAGARMHSRAQLPGHDRRGRRGSCGAGGAIHSC